MIERLGGPLRNPNSTKISAVGNVSIPDLELQIKNWQTVLANYRNTTDGITHEPTLAPTASSAPTAAPTPCPNGTFWNMEGQCEACSALHEECKDCECDDFTGEFAAVSDNCKAACL